MVDFRVDHTTSFVWNAMQAKRLWAEELKRRGEGDEGPVPEDG